MLEGVFSTYILINNSDMSKFNNILENNLDTTGLARIKIKFDPATEDNESRREYTGYVLEENETGVIAMIPQLGPDTFDLTPDQFEMEPSCGDNMVAFKKFVVKFLMERGYHDKVTEHMETILTADQPQQIESILMSCGCDNSVVLSLYRDYVSNE